MKAKIIPPIAICTLVLLSACHKSDKSTNVSVPDIDVAHVVTDSVIIHKNYPGTLVANATVNLVARVDGYLMSKPYKGGDYVEKGAVLFTIEDRNYRDALQKAEAQLSTAKANYAYASSRYEAMKRALEGDAVSKMEVEQAKSTLEETEASIHTAQASVQSAQTQLSYCTVRAPFSGRIATANYDVGAYLAGAASPVPLATIYQDHDMHLDFAIEDAEALAQLKEHMELHPKIFDSIPVEFSEPLSHKYTASLSYIAPSVDTSTGTIKLQARIENTYGELRSGMFGTISLPTAVDNDAMLVRQASIATDQLGSYIYVVNDSNRVVYTPIKTGEVVVDTMCIVSSGVTPGQKYVTKALLKVRDGMTVNPVDK